MRWGLFSVLFLGGCARALRKEEIIDKIGPEEFEQKIEQVSDVELGKIIVQTTSESPTQVTPSMSSGPEKTVPVPGPVELEKPLARGRVPKPPIEPAQKKKKAPDASVKIDKKPDPAGWQAESWPFGIGEKIVMSLRYGPLEAGEAHLEVKPPKVINGETVLHYTSRVRSAKIMDLVYKVDDVMHTWTGIDDHLPRRQEIHQNESGRWGKRVVVFNPLSHMAKFFSYTHFPDGREEQISREDRMFDFSQDVFGGLYFYRFVPDMKFLNFPIHDRWKNWANELTYLGPETVRVPAGEYQTQKFKMFPRVSGDLEPKGDVTIWIWDHPSKVMVQFSAKIRVGSVVGELKSWTPGAPIALPPPRLKTPRDLPRGYSQ